MDRLCVVHIDGNHNVTGCKCTDPCGFPCWQRVGIAPACELCGCPPFEPYHTDEELPDAA